jgi:hypothetical protein
LLDFSVNGSIFLLMKTRNIPLIVFLVWIAGFPLLSQAQPNTTESTTPHTQAEGIAAPQKLLLYTGQFNIEIFRLESGVEQIQALMDQYNGYIQQIQDQMVIIKIPFDQIQSTLNRIRGIGNVTYEEVGSQDLTLQYQNTRSRLQSALEVRENYADLLNRAQTVEEALLVETELRNLTQQIESYKGSLRYWEQNHAFGTFTLYFSVKQRFSLDRSNPFSWITGIGINSLLNAN